MFRSASPDSKSPVHWIITSGVAPPRCSPPATAQASPSRHTRTSRIPFLAMAVSHGPIVLSGTVTTCENFNSLSRPATCSEESIVHKKSGGSETRPTLPLLHPFSKFPSAPLGQCAFVRPRLQSRHRNQFRRHVIHQLAA